VSALTKYFFGPVDAPRSGWSIVGWWERRRLVYNLSVGAAGVASLTAIFGFEALPPRSSLLMPPIEPIIAYAILANICYSAGPAIDWIIRRRWGSQYAPVGPALLRYGFAFSVGLTLLPIPLAAMGWVLRVLRTVF
jgi:hypothetical protein